MQRTWGPFSGRHLTVIFVAFLATLVLLPSAVWAIDTFSNVAIEDPVSGKKASVDSNGKLMVDAYGNTVYTFPGNNKGAFWNNGYTLDYRNGGGYSALTQPTTATLALTDLKVTDSIDNADPSLTEIYQVAGTTASSCATNFGNGYKFLGEWTAPQGQSTIESFTTPLVVKPLSAGQSYCLVGTSFAPASANQSANGQNTEVSIGGYVVSGSFTPQAPAAPAGSPARPGADGG